MSSLLLLDQRYKRIADDLGFRTHADVVAYFGGKASASRADAVVQARDIKTTSGEIVQVFYKQYCYPRATWRFWGRHSKAWREFSSYGVFEQLKINCAERIACGEERDALGRLRHAFILTRAVPGSTTLLEYCRNPDAATGASPASRRHIGHELASMIRRLHQARYFHNDLFWRNVLVTSAPGNEPKLWWIDCPRGRSVWWPAARHRLQIKDLAALDIEAALWCNRAERLRFLLEYLSGGEKCRPGEWARGIERYRKRRWPAQKQEILPASVPGSSVSASTTSSNSQCRPRSVG
jgi:hypothetical protein